MAIVRKDLNDAAHRLRVHLDEFGETLADLFGVKEGDRIVASLYNDITLLHEHAMKEKT